MLFPSALRVCVSASLLVSGLSACTPPLSTAPLNQRIQTSLPALAGTADADGLDIFSFRIITSPEKVDLFSVLQVERKPWLTLPVGQLREVIAAKQKISEMEFLQPEYATKLAYETSRFYNWDLELARQVLVEVVQAYVDHRDSKMDAYRRYAAERATYFIEANRREQEEVQRQSQAVIEKQFYGVPQPKPVTYEEQLRRNAVYTEYTRQRIEKNRRAQEEFARQAKAAHERYLEKLDDMTRQAREKEATANRIRQAQQEALSTQSLDAPVPFALTALANGDFMLEARQALPAILELSVSPFTQPVLVPILPQTHNGRLLLSIEADAQGRPVVVGGMDAHSGGRFDLNEPVFALRYTASGGQELEFLYPDGRTESFDVAQMRELSSAEALQKLTPVNAQLSAEQLQLRQASLGQISYQFTPELRLMEPIKALELLESMQGIL